MSSKKHHQLQALLGDSLKTNSDEDVSVDSLIASSNAGPYQAKYVGLYFSAHWCPPCRAFTPKLVAFYNKLRQQQQQQADNNNKKNMNELEIVFISLDQDPDSFNDYFSTMPWLALPFDNAEGRTKLKDKFQISIIPNFVILKTSNGSLVSHEGRNQVEVDPEGKLFPWKNRNTGQFCKTS